MSTVLACTITPSPKCLSSCKSCATRPDSHAVTDKCLLYSQLVGLTIGPAFLSAAIYLCLGRIIVIYGAHLSRLRPRSYTLIFMGCDGISLILQSAGGAIASIANTQKGSDLGVHIMIAGLVSQVVSLTIFAALCADFAIQARKR